MDTPNMLSPVSRRAAIPGAKCKLLSSITTVVSLLRLSPVIHGFAGEWRGIVLLSLH